ncbi:hypothetical protein AB0J72_17955 [Dactylosporangium sp. NPDC049742]|uniref:hypothetical protein n=1 Tax=Dactylosporangium sp. NPDC049742 TaxID=3154737 RepID=UPI00341469F1
MPASLDRIRESMKVQPTARDKGLRLTIEVVAYDNGMIQVDGVPINASPAYDEGEGWLGAAEVAVATIGELRRQAVRRRRNAALETNADQ